MLQQIPKSLMTASADELVSVPLAVLESTLPGGGIPLDLQGHVFIVGPVGSVESRGLPSRDGVPIFNGNGMIYRVDFDRAGEASVSSKIARTPCYAADAATQPGSRFASLRFQNHGLLRFSAMLGLRNELNTAFLPILAQGEAPRLLVTYDAGRPYEIDTLTLDLVTPVGRANEWEPAAPTLHPFQVVLTTAHPFFDAHTGEMLGLNFGRSVLNLLHGSEPLSGELDEIGPAWERISHAVAAVVECAPRGPSRVASRVVRYALTSLRTHLAHAHARMPSLGALVARIPGLRGLHVLPETGSDFVHLMRWDGKGALERFRVVLPDGTPVRIEQSMHQMGVTRNYVVLADTAFKVGVESVVENPLPSSPGLERLLRALATKPQNPDTVLYIVARRDLVSGRATVEARRVVIPLESVHFLTDYEDDGDEITIHVAHNTAADVAEWIRSYDQTPSGNDAPAHLRGMLTLGQVDANRLGRYTIHGKTGEVTRAKVIVDAERALGIGLYAFRDTLPSGHFPGRHHNIYWQGWGLWPELSTEFVDSLYARYVRRALPLSELHRMRAEGGRPASLFRIDTATMAIADRYELPKRAIGDWLGSIQFVPRRGGNGGDTDGYLVTNVGTERGTEIWVFDAADLARGPVCKLGHAKLSFGMTIHAAWLPTIARRTATYNVPIREDLGHLVAASWSPEVRELFESEIYPQFGG